MARLTNAFLQYSDDSGKPIPEGKLYFYDSGTTDLRNTYIDSGLSIANANPLILDGAGRVNAPFLDGNYRVILTDKDDNQIREIDPIQGSLSDSQWSDWSISTTYGTTDIVRASNGEYYISLTGSNLGNDPISSPANWSQISFVTVWNINETYSENDNVFESGTQYKSLVDGNIGNLPSTSPAQWGVPTGGIVAGNPVSVLTNDVPYLVAGNDLSDVASAAATRTNLDVYSTGAVDTALSGKLDTGAKAADSELLDSLDSTQFLRSDVNTSTTGQISGITPTSAAHLTRKDYVDDAAAGDNWALKWTGGATEVTNSWGFGRFIIGISGQAIEIVVSNVVGGEALGYSAVSGLTGDFYRVRYNYSTGKFIGFRTDAAGTNTANNISDVFKLELL